MIANIRADGKRAKLWKLVVIGALLIASAGSCSVLKEGQG
jgi:hypothetical protein